MKRIHFSVSLDSIQRDEILEYPDDVDDETINDDFDIWIGEQISSNWWEEDKE